ncbi:hypothetical protein [Nocardia sp. NPDC003183]
MGQQLDPGDDPTGRQIGSTERTLVDLSDGRGVQFGDHNTQINYIVRRTRSRYFVPAQPINSNVEFGSSRRSSGFRTVLIAPALVLTIVAACISVWLVWPQNGERNLGIPLTVAVNAKHYPTAGWVSTREPAEALARPAYSGDWNGWATASNAVPAEHRSIILTVQGTSSASVTLTDLRIGVLQRRPAVQGTRYFTEGSGPAFRWVSFDVDRSPPVLDTHYFESLAHRMPLQERKPIRFPYIVSISEPESLLVEVAATECDCEFDIQLDWASQGQAHTAILNDAGRPFRITGLANITEKCTGGALPQSEKCVSVR